MRAFALLELIVKAENHASTSRMSLPQTIYIAQRPTVPCILLTGINELIISQASRIVYEYETLLVIKLSTYGGNLLKSIVLPNELYICIYTTVLNQHIS